MFLKCSVSLVYLFIFLHFVTEVPCLERAGCNPQTNALGDFSERRLSIQLCQMSHYVSPLCAAHVVLCSHMGFKHRMRAGAGIVQGHWRGNKHKQQALSCLEVSLIPMDVSCAIFPCVHNRHSSQSLTPKWCRSIAYTTSYTMEFTCSIMYEFWIWLW